LTTIRGAQEFKDIGLIKQPWLSVMSLRKKEFEMICGMGYYERNYP
jgi:hypothetical protein